MPTADRQDGIFAVLVHLNLYEDAYQEDASEFKELVKAAGVTELAFISINLNQPAAKYFIGTGKLEELVEEVTQLDAELVIFNTSLKPTQERNLEKALSCRVLDRTGLILDIFAQRARTYEGKLQVELAQLQHLTTRLIRGWGQLDRQKGGIGLRGPGETQLETDRQLIRKRISKIQRQLAKVRQQRATNARARQKRQLPSVAIVGYTNAGKSTLFNQLTDAEVFAADQLFATLDPTLRQLEIPHLGKVILADTVGFIRHLPHRLVEAFQATLQEAVDADLLIHLVDAASAEREDNLAQVEAVLEEIGAKQQRLEVFNKIDLLDFEPRLEVNSDGKPARVWLSATHNQGLDLLEQALAQLLSQKRITGCLQVEAKDAALRAGLFDLGAVVTEEFNEEGASLLTINLTEKDFNQLVSRLNLTSDALIWLENQDL